jgi:SET family sugar efflux transporter-like MFS transporter
MASTLALLRANPAIRAGAIGIFLYGFAGATTGPYQSVVGIRELGLSDSAYSALILTAAAVNVAASIGIGILSDRLGRYRWSMLLAAALGVVGYGMVWLLGTAWAFVLAALGPLTVFHALNSLFFASTRRHSAGLAKEDAAAVSSMMRAMISLAWIVVPGLVGLALSGSATLLPAYLIASALALAVLAVVLFLVPPDPDPDPATAAPALSLVATLGLLAQGPLVLRVLGVALITSVLHVNAAVMPLITTGRAQGTVSDVGYAVGFVAALEVIFILVWSRIARRIAPTAALTAGVAIYMVYLAALAQSSAPWHIYAASVAGGIGAAAIISLPLGYLLDLIADRPGLSASLIAVNIFLGGAIGSGLFALGTVLGDYGTVALLGAAAGLVGALGLMALEGWQVRKLAT